MKHTSKDYINILADAFEDDSALIYAIRSKLIVGEPTDRVIKFIDESLLRRNKVEEDIIGYDILDNEDIDEEAILYD